ncbi:hypothetical protein [Rhizobium sp. BG4]|uniref:hypothetical protein n=1 Tax=Rhizobium sp. BG4 TaxID=2613770 RepID=UPI00193E6D68|nr:hypothetical protein [Rhizobium sp. BG4]QRM44006.1 hypothetical protein F2982_11420 [Rhizobium sp. BG4]
MKTESTTITAADRADRALMVRLFQERGPQTDKQLLAAGISYESQAKNVPAVAEIVRGAELH